jgi:hypothetical protein
MQYQPRSAWGAAAPSWNPGRVAPSLGMFIHYNGPPVSPAVLAGDYQSVAAFLRATQRYHMQTNGWPDIAYSWAVDSVGRIWELRGWGTAGAHTMDWNWKSHAVFLCLGGDQAPTPEQLAACRELIAEHNEKYGIGFVKGHQEAPNSTSCPGPKVMELIRAGAFNPAIAQPKPPAPQVPRPNGVDPKVNKPVMMQEPGGTVWIYYAGTPWRVHVKTPDDVNVFKFLGVEYKVIDQKQANFFRKYSQEVKCG